MTHDSDERRADNSAWSAPYEKEARIRYLMTAEQRRWEDAGWPDLVIEDGADSLSLGDPMERCFGSNIPDLSRLPWEPASPSITGVFRDVKEAPL